MEFTEIVWGIHSPHWKWHNQLKIRDFYHVYHKSRVLGLFRLLRDRLNFFILISRVIKAPEFCAQRRFWRCKIVSKMHSLDFPGDRWNIFRWLYGNRFNSCSKMGDTYPVSNLRKIPFLSYQFEEFFKCSEREKP